MTSSVTTTGRNLGAAEQLSRTGFDHAAIECVQGWLEWSIQHAALPNGKFPMDISLVFCYANPVAQSPQQYLEADYLGAELLKIPAGVTFEEAFLAQCTSYELPYAPEQRLAAQSEEEEQALWHSLPEEVQARWGVLPRGPISSAQPDV